MTCKHRYEPRAWMDKMLAKQQKPNTHWWMCTRCNKIIFSTLTDRT